MYAFETSVPSRHPSRALCPALVVATALLTCSVGVVGLLLPSLRIGPPDLPSSRVTTQPAPAPLEYAVAAKATRGVDREAAAVAPRSDRIFQDLASKIAVEGPDLVPSVGAIFCFEITVPDEKVRSTWILDLLHGDGSVYTGVSAEATRKTFETEKMTIGGGDSVTITMSDEDFGDLIERRTNGMKLFVARRMKVSGNLLKLLSLNKVMEKAQQKDKDSAMSEAQTLVL